MAARRIDSDAHRPSDEDATMIDRHIAGATPARIAEAIRAGTEVSDYNFDRYLPDALRLVSGQFWTPIEVAVRVADWFEAAGVERVVDIGSGAGKFCVVAAVRGRARYVGMEQRPRLVRAASSLAHRFEVADRVSFMCASLGDVDVPAADAYYLYNPFGENLFGPLDCLDADVELGHERFVRDVTLVHAMLDAAPLGTYLVTYNGFGGFVPVAYEEVEADLEMPNVLRMFRKVRETEDDPSSRRGPFVRG